jgi:hypothetical protein
MKKFDIFPSDATEVERQFMAAQLYIAGGILAIVIVFYGACFFAARCFAPHDELFFFTAIVAALTLDLLFMFLIVFRILYRRAG